MRVIALALNDIKFEQKLYDPSLEESILRRGLAFPVKVRLATDGYYCVDGAKRLSVLKQLALTCPNHRYVTKIPVIVVNSSNIRSNDCWRPRNMH